MIAGNAPPEIIESVIAQFNRSENEQCEVWEENVETFDLFLKLQTQWVISSSGSGAGFIVGLNYASVKAFLQTMLPARRVKAVFRDIQIMEHAALPLLNKKKED